MHKQKGKKIKAAWVIQPVRQMDERRVAVQSRRRKRSQEGSHQPKGHPLSDPHSITQSQEQREDPESACHKAKVLSKWGAVQRENNEPSRTNFQETQI